MSNSPSVLHLGQMVQNEDKDRLSSLPDDILVSILQLIDMNDATRTSVLLRRWRYLAPYSYFTVVDLDARKTSLVDCKTSRISYNDARPKFLNWVHQGSCFKNGSSNLTSLCLRFVNISGELLELFLSHFPLLERLYIESSNELQNLKIINSSEKLKHLAIHWCKFVKEIEIHAVNLLSFEFSHSHKSHNFSESPTGSVNVIYASVPSLVDARFCWGRCASWLPYFLQIHCFAAQLTKLSLQMIVSTDQDPHLIPSFPNVKDLELQVTVGHHRFDGRHMNLFRLRRYAEACPVLDNVKLQINWSCDCGDDKEIQLSDSESSVDFDSNYGSDIDLDSDSDSGPEEYSLEEVKQWLEEKEGVNATLPFLRKLELTAAFSHHFEAEYELALYFVKNAVMLEKFICNPQFEDENWIQYSMDVLEEDIRRQRAQYNMDVLEEDVRRQRARKLAVAIPSCIDFTIL
ncbi:uncharacterized protein LOC110698314 isoform X1 [Chenopodium quinoa]|uniref:uncharacterized protein LOC110698314 isoform X1 n=1 Tax=Chenopodium quinoa TaxID=63459 RepID=UPI000B787FEF|nr:uncharacterized protein LOC110698314 isoform X1 [Chenopodium quinoa]